MEWTEEIRDLPEVIDNIIIPYNTIDQKLLGAILGEIQALRRELRKTHTF